MTPHLQTLAQKPGNGSSKVARSQQNGYNSLVRCKTRRAGFQQSRGANTASENIKSLAMPAGVFVTVNFVSWSLGFGPLGIVGGQLAPISL